MRIRMRDPTTHFFLDLDPPMLQNDPQRLPPLHFDAEPGPFFHFDAHADPDPLPKMIRFRNTGWDESYYVPCNLTAEIESLWSRH
jgi:hypothetical protein